MQALKGLRCERDSCVNLFLPASLRRASRQTYLVGRALHLAGACSKPPPLTTTQVLPFVVAEYTSAEEHY